MEERRRRILDLLSQPQWPLTIAVRFLLGTAAGPDGYPVTAPPRNTLATHLRKTRAMGDLAMRNCPTVGSLEDYPPEPEFRPAEVIKWSISRGMPMAAEFRDWAEAGGVVSPPESPLHGHPARDPTHAHAAPELIAAVRAWEAVFAEGQLAPGLSPKTQLERWLAKHHGDLTEKTRSRIAKVANPNKKGGGAEVGLRIASRKGGASLFRQVRTGYSSNPGPRSAELWPLFRPRRAAYRSSHSTDFPVRGRHRTAHMKTNQRDSKAAKLTQAAAIPNPPHPAGEAQAPTRLIPLTSGTTTTPGRGAAGCATWCSTRRPTASRR